ncbi:MAG TPA: MFS transporter [Burkholderiales bacterium]|nr:MFS transporter [Betaproteobacteria bacterium]HQR53183.1 MFS transporter [Burkholderiales bacterium]
MNLAPYLQVVRSPRVAAVLVLGFASGLPLALSAGTLQAWMTVAGVDIKTIGLFSLVGLPYTVKFLWAPVMDRYAPGFLGRRRGWVALTQLVLMGVIALMGAMDPTRSPLPLAALALVLAFASASQDIVVDAYRTDVLRENERGLGAAVSVLGYRLALLVSGALALILSDHIGWRNTYWLMAALMVIGLLAAILGPEPEVQVRPPRTLGEAVVGPLKEFFGRPEAGVMLLLIVLYKLGDAFAGSLTTAFLIRGVGFTPTDVGAINKGLGLFATIIGALFGGGLMVRLGLYRALLLFGILQAVSNLAFMVLAWAGKSYPLMVVAVAVENIAGGMGTAAFVALLMALCDQRFSATQFALLSALAAIGRVFVGPPSGLLVDAVGWVWFFFCTFLVALPGLLLLWRLRQRVSDLGHAGS